MSCDNAERKQGKAAIVAATRPSRPVFGPPEREVPDPQLDELVTTLRNHPLNTKMGPSFNGPGAIEVIGDDLTRAIIAKGDAIVPKLIAELKQSDLNESVLIVYCLTELKASNARPAVVQLRKQRGSGERFAGEHRDGTLLQIIHDYLAVCGGDPRARYNAFYFPPEESPIPPGEIVNAGLLEVRIRWDDDLKRVRVKAILKDALQEFVDDNKPTVKVLTRACYDDGRLIYRAENLVYLPHSGTIMTEAEYKSAGRED
jgi:hypothetical protein